MSRSSSRLAFASLLFVTCHAAFGEDLPTWLREKVAPPDKGATEWTLVLTTGHFGRDPRLATATRDEAVRALQAVGAKEDRVRVVAAEMRPWGDAKTVAIEDLASALPSAPAPESRGGRDIEAVLSTVASEAKGPILVLSPGPSQLPADGKGTLKGGDGHVDGFQGPERATFNLPTVDGPRSVFATLLTKPEAFAGQEPRTRLPSSVPKRADPLPSKPLSDGSKEGGFPAWGWIPVLAVGLLGGYALGRSRKTPEVIPVPIATPKVEGDLENQAAEAELSAWRDEARKQQRKLDMVAQDLAAAAEQMAGEADAEKMALRQDLARRERAVQVWDETAIDYLDGIYRALDHPELAPDRRQTWERAATQFIRLSQRAGLDVISPNTGDPVLDGQHRIESVVSASSELPANTVVSVIAPGYRRGDQVLRQARIVMARNELS